VGQSTGATDNILPEALRNHTTPPPSLRSLLVGPSRPPCDALAMMRAYLVAPLLAVRDSPTAIQQLLRSNPTVASQCGFLGRDVPKEPGEWTSRRLPSLSTLEEFNEVMTR
jgi:hypothetical protein